MKRRAVLKALAVTSTSLLPITSFAKQMKEFTLPTPPVANRIAHSYSRHGYTITDPYFWLKDQGYPKVTEKPVLDYLKAENSYREAIMAPNQAVTDQLFAELKARVKDDDASVPQKDGAFIYQSRFAPQSQYRTWVRWPVGKTAADEAIILDEPTLAKGHEYFRLGGHSVSEDGRLIAYSTDTNGSERFTIRVRDLVSGRDLDDTIDGSIGAPVWQTDGKAFVWQELSPEWRSFRTRLHVLGTDPKNDAVLYEEKDTGFSVGVGLTTSKKWLVLNTGDNITSEVRLIPADNFKAAPRLVSARREGHQYEVDEREAVLYIRTNDHHINFRVATAPVATPEETHWQDLIAGSDDHYITGLESHKNVLVIEEKIAGLEHVRLRGYDGHEHRIAFPEPAYTTSVSNNPDYEIVQLRLSYASMITPTTVYDYDLMTRTLVSRKVQEIPSGYDKTQYATERLQAPGRDGKLVPVSIVYKKTRGTKAGPLHLYAYGSYGYAVPPNFSASRLSLLDRGFAYAIAHVRGGDDLGYGWYLQGKTHNRKNTFNDYVDVAKFLIEKGYTKAGDISCEGRSAGGQVMGAITNMAPELWRAVIADVPFVDVMNTMQDESLPLTPGEWPEWGNPIKNKADFDYMMSYSPYENVSAKAYPNMWISGGLNDPRVTYWEPAKWAAKLRHDKTDHNLLLVKINMGAGHGGKSGRYDSLLETAQEYTFLLKSFHMI